MVGDPYTGMLKRSDRVEDIRPTLAGRFTIGELLPWKGFWFEVAEIKEQTITLKARGSKPR